MDDRSPFRHTSNRSLEREAAHRSKWRLLGLLVLFDVLLIVAVLLSFQSTELVEEEVILRQTREVYDVQIREQVVTHTTVITQVIPYGSTP